MYQLDAAIVLQGDGQIWMDMPRLALRILAICVDLASSRRRSARKLIQHARIALLVDLEVCSGEQIPVLPVWLALQAVFQILLGALVKVHASLALKVLCRA